MRDSSGGEWDGSPSLQDVRDPGLLHEIQSTMRRRRLQLPSPGGSFDSCEGKDGASVGGLRQGDGVGWPLAAPVG